MAQFSIKGLNQFINQMKKAKWQMPLDADKFMTKEAKKLINESKQASPYATFKNRWFTKTRKATKNSIWKGVFNKASHLHLVNDGHRMIGHRPKKQYLGQVKGKHFLEPVISNFSMQFDIDMEKFLNGVWE